MEVLESSEAAILDRVLRPDVGGWPRAASETLLNVSFGPQGRGQISLLLANAKGGTIGMLAATGADEITSPAFPRDAAPSRAQEAT